MNKKKRLEYLKSQIRIERMTEQESNTKQWLDAMNSTMGSCLAELFRIPLLNDNDSEIHWVRKDE